jgi:hypothetical protein
MIIKSKYAGKCRACGEPYGVGQDVEWTRGISGARHVSLNICAAAKQKAHDEKLARAAAGLKIERPTLDLKPIVAFLQAAKDRGLKRPKLRVLAPNGVTELRIGLTVVGIAPGSVSIVAGDMWLGAVRPNGEMAGAIALDVVLQKHLLRVASDPVTAAQEYARLMSRCSFCNAPLTDAGSVEVGYGPVCAQHWGLPWVRKGTGPLAPVPQEA